MTDLLKSIGEHKLLEEDELALLRNNFGGMAQHIFRNQLSNSPGSTTKQKYNQQIKQFALTLHYYSPKTYDYVRTILHYHILQASEVGLRLLTVNQDS